jgi:DNA-binding NarL/FixJ family response regulator
MDVARGPEVVVISEDPLIRSGLASLLQGQGIASASASSLTAAADALADVAVWDLGGASNEVPDRLEELQSSRHTVIALLPDPTHAASAYAAGARGLLLRDADGQSLAAALMATRAGLVVADPIVAEALVPTREPMEPSLELTPREGEVLAHLSDGLSNKEIAGKMGISDHTVKFHVNAILQKLGASTRTEAVVRAARRGLITL